MSEKTIIYSPEGAGYGSNGLDPNLWMSMMNNGGMGGGNFFWAIILLAFLRNGLGWNGGDGNYNMSYISSQLAQGFGGNTNAISNLATSLNCTNSQIQQAIAGIQSTIQNVGAQNNMSFAQTVNAIQAGNTAIANQISQCCCDNKLLFTQQNYENRINNTEQTAILGGKIDNQTTIINDKFCQLEMREMQNKLDNERSKNLALTNQLSQEHQNNYFAAMIAPLKSELDAIKCKLPETATIPYSPVVGVPSCVAYNYGLNALGLAGFNSGIVG